MSEKKISSGEGQSGSSRGGVDGKAFRLLEPRKKKEGRKAQLQFEDKALHEKEDPRRAQKKSHHGAVSAVEGRDESSCY